MSSSTSARVLGFALDRLTDEEIATILHVSRKDVPARRKQLTEQHADPAWVARELEKLPSATLAVLHLVIAGGGMVLEAEAYRAAKEQFAMAEQDVHAAAAVALERLFMVPLKTSRGDVLFGVSHPASAQIAPLVAGLDALPLAPEAFVRTEHVLRNPRTFLAICAATRHVDIKLTTEGRPHRTATKRLAKQVGIHEALVDEVLGAGLATEVLRVDGEILRPEPAALAEAAAGRYPFAPLVTASRDRLAAGPQAIRALLQSLLRRHDLSVSGYVGPEAFDFLPGFVTGTIEGTRGVALAVPEPIDGVASGHVTPSFEIMLPPESRLLDIVQVGACCDWERLDRAIVGRISKASVMRAVAAGASAAAILAHLGAASRHPIPQNVEAAIRDWGGAVVAATIGRGYVVQVEPGARERVAAGMQGLGARELAPGVFLIERETGLREIQTTLSRAGAMHSEAEPARPLPPPAAPAPALLPAAARLRSRVAAWRRNEPFEGKRDDFLERNRAGRNAAPAASNTDMAALHAVEAQLVRWERAHGVAIPRDDLAYHAMLGLLGALPPALRTRILSLHHDLPQLLRALQKLPVNPAGRGARGPRRTERRPPPLLWQNEHLRERLQQAAEDVEAVALDLPDRVRYVEIDSVLRRGKAWMVLGNDVTNGEAVAVQLDDIRAIAALPDQLEAYDLEVPVEAANDLVGEELHDEDLASELPRKPWHPAPGEPPPAGHLLCPCGSGSRYRNCCRDLPRA
jgi:hypothetical protein